MEASFPRGSLSASGDSAGASARHSSGTGNGRLFGLVRDQPKGGDDAAPGKRAKSAARDPKTKAVASRSKSGAPGSGRNANSALDGLAAGPASMLRRADELSFKVGHPPAALQFIGPW